MSDAKWTKDKPTQPGWYWCRNGGDQPGEIWEAVVRVEQYGTIDFTSAKAEASGLVACWLQSPGQVGFLEESKWDSACWWAGPLAPPAGRPAA